MSATASLNRPAPHVHIWVALAARWPEMFATSGPTAKVPAASWQMDRLTDKCGLCDQLTYLGILGQCVCCQGHLVNGQCKKLNELRSCDGHTSRVLKGVFGKGTVLLMRCEFERNLSVCRQSGIDRGDGYPPRSCALDNTK